MDNEQDVYGQLTKLAHRFICGCRHIDPNDVAQEAYCIYLQTKSFDKARGSIRDIIDRENRDARRLTGNNCIDNNYHIDNAVDPQDAADNKDHRLSELQTLIASLPESESSIIRAWIDCRGSYQRVAELFGVSKRSIRRYVGRIKNELARLHLVMG